MLTCSKCGARVGAGRGYCENCGVRLTSTMHALASPSQNVGWPVKDTSISWLSLVISLSIIALFLSILALHG